MARDATRIERVIDGTPLVIVSLPWLRRQVGASDGMPLSAVRDLLEERLYNYLIRSGAISATASRAEVSSAVRARGWVLPGGDEMASPLEGGVALTAPLERWLAGSGGEDSIVGPLLAIAAVAGGAYLLLRTQSTNMRGLRRRRSRR